MNSDRIAFVVTMGLVVALIAIGLFILGTPADQRLLRLDEKRVVDLIQLTQALDDYWEETKSLPDRSGDLLDGRRLKHMPSDPGTGMPYVYEKKDQFNYRLCASFDRPSQKQTSDNFWVHPVGRHCFSFVQNNTNLSDDVGND